MEILLIYGGDLISSYNKLLEIKNKFNSLEITELDKKFLDFNLEFLTQGLFSSNRLIILKEIDEDFNLKEIPKIDNLTVCLYLAKEISPVSPILKEAKSLSAKIYYFPKEREITPFLYLDLLAEKNPKAFEELEKLYSLYGGQYLFSMIYYLLRRNTQEPKQSIFAQQKISKQKLNFPLSRLNLLYRNTLETDFKIKQGLMEEKLGLFLLTEKFLTQ